MLCTRCYALPGCVGGSCGISLADCNLRIANEDQWDKTEFGQKSMIVTLGVIVTSVCGLASKKDGFAMSWPVSFRVSSHGGWPKPLLLPPCWVFPGFCWGEVLPSWSRSPRKSGGSGNRQLHNHLERRKNWNIVSSVSYQCNCYMLTLLLSKDVKGCKR